MHKINLERMLQTNNPPLELSSIQIVLPGDISLGGPDISRYVEVINQEPQWLTEIADIWAHFEPPYDDEGLLDNIMVNALGMKLFGEEYTALLNSSGYLSGDRMQEAVRLFLCVKNPKRLTVGMYRLGIGVLSGLEANFTQLPTAYSRTKWEAFNNEIRSTVNFENYGLTLDRFHLVIPFILKDAQEEFEKLLRIKDSGIAYRKIHDLIERKDAQISTSLYGENILAEAGNLKRLIYANDQETLLYAASLGITMQPFITLTDPQLVYHVLKSIDPQFRATGAYQKFQQDMRSIVGKDPQAISEEDIRVYADEIAFSLLEASEKNPKLKSGLVTLDDHVRQAMQDGEVSFRLATRDVADRKLGNLCGDCTQEGGINEDKVQGWEADAMTQYFKMYHQGKFIGRNNITIVESNSGPLMLIDATEFIPQAREIPRYENAAKEAFAAGFRKIIQIADGMGIKQIAACTYSNSTDMEVEYAEQGFEEDRIFGYRLIRKKSLKEVVGASQEIPFYLQSCDANLIQMGAQIAKFEQHLNRLYAEKDEQRGHLKTLVKEGKFDQAGDLVWNTSIMGNIEPTFLLGMNWGSNEIALALQSLYGSHSSDRWYSAKLRVIR